MQGTSPPSAAPRKPGGRQRAGGRHFHEQNRETSRAIPAGTTTRQATERYNNLIRKAAARHKPHIQWAAVPNAPWVTCRNSSLRPAPTHPQWRGTHSEAVWR
jgi:hypothetical protein